MKDLSGRVAVVTGAASGIGRAVAGLLVDSGTKVVLADVEPAALANAESELRARGEVAAVLCDVSQAAAVDRLAHETLKAFGAVHILCNNAGVSLGGAIWEHGLDDWKWVLSVNLGGVIHGCRTFVPLLLKHGNEAHIVNVASVSGLVCPPLLGVYTVSKHAVVAYSETLHHDLRRRGLGLGVSVVCPGWVATDIMDASRTRPGPPSSTTHPEFDRIAPVLRQFVARGQDPRDTAMSIVDAIRNNQFWVLPDEDSAQWLRQRCDLILRGEEPEAPPVLGAGLTQT